MSRTPCKSIHYKTTVSNPKSVYANAQMHFVNNYIIKQAVVLQPFDYELKDHIPPYVKCITLTKNSSK